MKLAIMQPYFFPYLGYFQLINSVNVFIFYDDVQYINRGWVNRNYLLSKEGKQLFTIPIQKHDLKDKIIDIRISQENWQSKFLNTLFFTYKKAPFFDIIFPVIQSIILSKNDYLVQLISKSFDFVIKYLNINTKLVKSSELNLLLSNNKIERINNILETLNVETFILPPGSVNLYSPVDFITQTYFLQMEKIRYPQFAKTRFEENLSFIDILMFNSVENIKNLLSSYTLN